jgi:hypothetical protein
LHTFSGRFDGRTGNACLCQRRKITDLLIDCSRGLESRSRVFSSIKLGKAGSAWSQPKSGCRQEAGWFLGIGQSAMKQNGAIADEQYFFARKLDPRGWM